MVKKQAEEMEEFSKLNGSEREALLAKELGEAQAKVLEVQKQLSESEEALGHARSELGDAQRAAARGEGAEKEIAALREEGRKHVSEIEELKAMVKKQAEEME